MFYSSQACEMGAAAVIPYMTSAQRAVLAGVSNVKGAVLTQQGVRLRAYTGWGESYVQGTVLT